MASKEDPYERASRRILSALLEAEAIELVTERGLIGLARSLATFLLRTETFEDRGTRVAEWLVEHVEVVDLWADDEQIEALLARHWDVDDSPGESLGTKRASPELEAALLEARDDDDPCWLVYSDWLQSRGDLLGELGALQAAMRTPDVAASKRAQRRVAAFVRAHREALLGVAGEYHRIVRLEWGVGTLRAARISTTRYGDKQFHGAILLDALLERAVARYLRELWLGPIDQKGSDQYGEMVAVLLRQSRPALRELAIGTADLDGSTHGIVRNPGAMLGDLRMLEQRLPRLEALRLSGGNVELGALHSNRLQRLALRLRHASEASLDAIGASSLPSLRELCWGVLGAPRAVVPAFQALFDQLPALERLVVERGGLEMLHGTCIFQPRARPPLRELVVLNTVIHDDARTHGVIAQLELERLELRSCDVRLGAEGRRRIESRVGELVIEQA